MGHYWLPELQFHATWIEHFDREVLLKDFWSQDRDFIGFLQVTWASKIPSAIGTSTKPDEARRSRSDFGKRSTLGPKLNVSLNSHLFGFIWFTTIGLESLESSNCGLNSRRQFWRPLFRSSDLSSDLSSNLFRSPNQMLFYKCHLPPVY